MGKNALWVYGIYLFIYFCSSASSGHREKLAWRHTASQGSSSHDTSAVLSQQVPTDVGLHSVLCISNFRRLTRWNSSPKLAWDTKSHTRYWFYWFASGLGAPLLFVWLTDWLRVPEVAAHFHLKFLAYFSCVCVCLFCMHTYFLFILPSLLNAARSRRVWNCSGKHQSYFHFLPKPSLYLFPLHLCLFLFLRSQDSWQWPPTVRTDANTPEFSWRKSAAAWNQGQNGVN